MAWSTPKIDWAAADGVAYVDLNRIEENTRVTYNMLTETSLHLGANAGGFSPGTVALGWEANASAANTIAIGNMAIASAANATAIELMRRQLRLR